MSEPSYNVIQRPDGRFIIVDAFTREVLDDAQGYGYKTKKKATNAGWYKFKGGKAKHDAAKRDTTEILD